MTDIKIVDLAEVRRLEKFIGDNSYTTKSVDGRGRYEVAIHISNWEGRRGYQLFWEALRMLWRAIPPTRIQYVKKQAEQPPEAA